MSRLIDASICADCRQPLDADSRCTGCGLVFTGPLGGQLWSTMQAADRIVEQIRIQSPASASPAPAAYPTFPIQPPPLPRPKRKLPAFSVPVVLLTLGGLCLSVAALVFVLVAWDLLGLAGRTLVLVGFTVLLGYLGRMFTLRNLRGAAETFWVLTATMLVIDLAAARSADLLGMNALSDRGISAVIGVAMIAVGLAPALWVRRHPMQNLYGAQLVAALGLLLLISTNGWDGNHPAAETTVGLVLLAAIAVALHRWLPYVAYSAAALAGASWLALTGFGLDRTVDATSREWFLHLRGWPLLVAVLVGAVVSLQPRLPEAARTGAAIATIFPAVVFALGPDGGTQRNLLVGSGALVALALLSLVPSKVWRHAAAGWGAAGAVLAAGMVLAQPWVSLGDSNHQGTLALTDHLDLVGTTRLDAWVWLALAASAAFTAISVARQIPSTRQPFARDVLIWLVSLFALLAATTSLIELDVPLWVPAAVLLAGMVLAGAQVLVQQDHRVAVTAGVIAMALASALVLRIGFASDLLMSVALTVLAGVLSVLAARLAPSTADGTALPGFAGSATLAIGAALAAWLDQFGVNSTATAMTLAVVAAAAGMTAHWLGRSSAARVAVELGAAVVALGALATTMNGADGAMVLTIVGTAICVSGVSHDDRQLLRWAGAGVLGVATVLRLIVDVSAPELYSLPAAALLLGMGIWRLRQDPTVDSYFALASGLTLALTPSLLIALDDPISLRGALIAAGGLIALGVGVRLRWAAPFLAGAVTTAILALRHAQLLTDGVPRWITLGGVGVVLLIVGITWEARMRNISVARHYLRDLR